MKIADGDFEKFMAKVAVDSEGCWMWKGSVHPTGYGRFHVGKPSENRMAHRVSYVMHVGEIPQGMVIDHLCREPLCVRPDHLEAVTQAENVARGLSGHVNRNKTHCKRGHEFNEQNTKTSYHNGQKRRQCRPCVRFLAEQKKADRKPADSGEAGR